MNRTQSVPEREGRVGPAPDLTPEKHDSWSPGLGKTFAARCESCMYFINYRCRRHAPRGQEGWPAVFIADWCGDHKLSKDMMNRM